jgi:S1-C subfamily serine protease
VDAHEPEFPEPQASETQAPEPQESSTPPAQPAPAPAAPRSQRARRRRTVSFVGGAAAGALVIGIGGYAVGATTAPTTQQVTTQADPAFVPRVPQRTELPGSASGSSQSTQVAPIAPTEDELTGVVTIVSELYYGEGAAAGTGMVLTADGTVLTNNHVVEGATDIKVTDESTGKTYSAAVVGTDATNDVAVLQLQDASGLATVTIEQSEEPAIGDEVTSVGNAEGTGTLVAASGAVTDLNQNITVASEPTGKSAELDGLIEVDAYVVSGDSGGPLLDSDGDVVGIVTAASSGSALVTGYAIDIDEALAVWQLVEQGKDTDTVEIGLPAFLGILLGSATPSTTGVRISGVIDGTPAAEAGLGTGDVITAIDGVRVTTSDGLSAAISAHDPGDWVSLSFTGTDGAAHGATVTLTEGPAA